MTLPARRLVRTQDLFIAGLFGTLAWFGHSSEETVLIVLLGLLQLLEGRNDWLRSDTGRATLLVLQLLVIYLLIGISGGVNSIYYLLLLAPVIWTATYAGLAGTVIGSVVAIGAYLSFLLYIDWSVWSIDPEAVHLLTIRCLLLAVAAVLVNALGEAVRRESARYKDAAEQLAAANQSLRDAEAAVRRSERLAALGQLSAGLAHELRNPLGSIRGSAELLVRRSAIESPMVVELAQIISEEVDRTNMLVTRFLDFARPLEPRLEETDITVIIGRAANHARVEIIRNFSPEVPPLWVDPALMEQVLLNLLSNAAQASLEGAPITVATRLIGDEAEIAVVDRGSGVAPEKVETIFNPFVTTKQSGVGLGLAIVAKIVDGHKGRITVESEQGKGSAFRIYLPLQSPVKPVRKAAE
ncbi:MAG: signal transduction histidine kinase, nitrogen specific, NtrB [Bryobacterales bacterium]|nr:signal transduction histidine kinase, nitrogen specific, NtrB [Bryobacterales bacterium]